MTKLIEAGKQDYIPGLKRGDAIAITTKPRTQTLGVVRGYSKIGAIQLVLYSKNYDGSVHITEHSVRRCDTKQLVRIDVKELPPDEQKQINELILKHKQ